MGAPRQRPHRHHRDFQGVKVEAVPRSQGRLRGPNAPLDRDGGRRVGQFHGDKMEPRSDAGVGLKGRGGGGALKRLAERDQGVAHAQLPPEAVAEASHPPFRSTASKKIINKGLYYVLKFLFPCFILHPLEP